MDVIKRKYIFHICYLRLLSDKMAQSLPIYVIFKFAKTSFYFKFESIVNLKQVFSRFLSKLALQALPTCATFLLECKNF